MQGVCVSAGAGRASRPSRLRPATEDLEACACLPFLRESFLRSLWRAQPVPCSRVPETSAGAWFEGVPKMSSSHKIPPLLWVEGGPSVVCMSGPLLGGLGSGVTRSGAVLHWRSKQISSIVVGSWSYSQLSVPDREPLDKAQQSRTSLLLFFVFCSSLQSILKRQRETPRNYTALRSPKV